MNRLWMLTLLLPISASAGRPLAQPESAARRPSPHHMVPGDPEVKELRRSMRDLRGLISTLRNPAMIAEMERRLDRMDRQLARLDTARWNLIDTATALEAEAIDCARALDVAQRPPPPPPEPIPEVWYPPEPVITTPAELAAIRRAVQQATFDKDKLATLRGASRDRAFTVAQVRGLLDLFTFGKDKIQAAEMLHPLVVDLENWFQVYAAFEFESDRRKLRQRVGD